MKKPLIKSGLRRPVSLLTALLITSVSASAIDIQQENPEQVQVVRVQSNQVWAAFPNVLFYSEDGGLNFERFDSLTDLGRGTVSAMVVTDTAVWAATYIDSVISGSGQFKVNNGLYKSALDAIAWDKLARHVAPTAGNVTWDIQVNRDTLWTANWIESVKQSTDGGQTWRSVNPTDIFYDPQNVRSQQAWSIAVDGNLVVCGSDGGVNVSVDGGNDWLITSFSGPEGVIPGNKIAAVALRTFNQHREIWAAAWPSGAFEGEDFGVLRSVDFGQEWQGLLTGIRAWNFFFHDEDIFIASSSGLYFATGEPAAPTNLTSGKLPFGTSVYDIAMSPESTLWIGTSDGLYYGAYDGSAWSKVDLVPTAIDDDAPQVPDQFSLGQNFPNPFNPETTIPVTLDRSGSIRVTVYNILGSEVKRLYDGFQQAGTNRYTWDGTDNANRAVTSGVYFYRLQTDRGSAVRRMVFLK
jgi:hypothetical protein